MSGNGSGEAARTPGQAMVPAAGRNIAVRREGAMAAGAVAMGAVALGAMAVGVLAIGRLAIGRLALRVQVQQRSANLLNLRRWQEARVAAAEGEVKRLRPTLEEARRPFWRRWLG